MHRCLFHARADNLRMRMPRMESSEQFFAGSLEEMQEVLALLVAD